MIAQTPWTERHFSFDFSIGLFPVIFSRLEGTLFRLHLLLQNADEEACSFSKQGWSVKEHIGHLYDLEDLWWQRLHDYQQGNIVLTAADISNKKTTEAGHNGKTLEQLLQQFTLQRQHMLESIFILDKEMLNQTAIHQRLNQPLRLVDLLYFIAEHDDHHLAKITSLLRKPVAV